MPEQIEPMVPAQILHVDDDQQWLDIARDYLQGEAIDAWGRPHIESLDTFTSALAALETRRIDLVILDVRLGRHEAGEIAEADEEEGIRTLDAIRSRRFVPVIFWTNLPRLVAHLEGPLVRVLSKPDGLAALKDSVDALFATRLPTVNRALVRLVEEEQRRYMWDFVAEHWDALGAGNDHLGVAYLLARRLGRSLSGPAIQRLAGALGAEGMPQAQGDVIHPAEMYLIPPLEGTDPSVADVYRKHDDATGGESWWLVLTPTCDLQMQHVKADRVVVAKCMPVERHPALVAWRRQNNGRNRQEVKYLLANSTGGQRDRYLFLPAAPTIPNLVADFQCLENVSLDELHAMTRVASLVSPFAEAAVSRFIRYFGRLGTADLDADSLFARL